MASKKKRTGLDALNEYEAQSGRQSQSVSQQAASGSSGGTWRSGLDALREYEANGGGQNVRNGPYNPGYRTGTRPMSQEEYTAAYEKYRKIAGVQQAGYRRQQRLLGDTSNRDVDNDILTSRQREQEGLFKRYQQAMAALEGRERQTRRIMDTGDEFGAEPNQQAQTLRQGWKSAEQRAREAQSQLNVMQDQERGRQRTYDTVVRQIDQLERAREYQLASQADDPDGLPEYRSAYDAVNAGRQTPMTLTEMDDALRTLRYRRSVMDKSVSGRVGEYAEDLGRGVFKGGFEQWSTGFESAMSYLEQGANGAAAWALRDLSKAIPDGALKQKMLALADDFESYWTGESETRHEELARQHREELQKLENEIADKYTGAALWVQQQMPSAGSMVFGAGVSGSVGVNNLATLGVTAGGSSALDAKEKGASDAQALAYGVVAGGLEVLSERLFGGNPIYDTDAGLVNKAVSKLTDNKTIMKILNSKAFDIASEGLEEVVTEVLDPVAEWAIYNGSNTEFADAESIGNAFLGGVFLSVVGNVADAPNQIRQARYERVLKIAGRELADIADTVDSAPVQEAAQVIRDKIAYGVTPDAADIGAVLDAMNQAGEAVDAERVQAAVEAENEANGAAEKAASDAVQAASAENGSRAPENEEAFRLYNQAADARDAAARKAENARRARAEEHTEAINDAEANRAAEAFEDLTEEEVKGAAGDGSGADGGAV